MDIQQAKAEVSSALIEMAEQLETVLNRKGQIPQIEIDLLLTNTQRLYSYLVTLSRLNSGFKPDTLDKPKVQEAPAVKTEEIARLVQSEVGKLRDEMFRTFTTPKTTEVNNPVVEPIVAPTPFGPQPSTKPTPQTGPSAEKLAKIKENPYIGKTVMPNGLVEEKHHDLAVEEMPVIEMAPVVVENFLKPEPQPEVKPVVQPEPVIEAKTVVEPVAVPLDVTLPPITIQTAKVVENVPVNQADNTVVNKLRGKGITNIKSAIGINDKFQYLNDLFKGNVQDYNESLDALNNFSTLEQAEAHFNALRSKFGWDMENTSATGLYELVIRRYVK